MANNYDPYIRKPMSWYIAAAWLVAALTTFTAYLVAGRKCHVNPLAVLWLVELKSAKGAGFWLAVAGWERC
jgi:hypothetical protein